MLSGDVVMILCSPADPTILPTRGPCSKYVINIPEGDFKAKLEMKFEGDPFKVSENFCHSVELLKKDTLGPVRGCQRSIMH